MKLAMAALFVGVLAGGSVLLGAFRGNWLPAAVVFPWWVLFTWLWWRQYE